MIDGHIHIERGVSDAHCPEDVGSKISELNKLIEQA